MATVIWLLAWLGAVGFTGWVAYSHNHPVWACAIVLLGVAAVEIKRT